MAKKLYFIPHDLHYFEIVAQGKTTHGLPYFIVTRGWIILVYIKCDKDYYIEDPDDFPVVPTWFGPHPKLPMNGDFIGWDYGHISDYMPILNEQGHKYTIDEILQDIEFVSEYIIKHGGKSNE